LDVSITQKGFTAKVERKKMLRQAKNSRVHLLFSTSSKVMLIINHLHQKCNAHASCFVSSRSSPLTLNPSQTPSQLSRENHMHAPVLALKEELNATLGEQTSKRPAE